MVNLSSRIFLDTIFPEIGRANRDCDRDWKVTWYLPMSDAGVQ